MNSTACPICGENHLPTKRQGATAQRLKLLIESGEIKTRAQAAEQLGISRERVRQLLNKLHIELRKNSKPGTLIRWNCPNCGMELQAKPFNLNRRKTKYCKSCVAKLHPRKRRNPDIYIFCADCGKTYRWKGRSNMFRSVKIKKTPYCQRCWGRRVMKGRSSWVKTGRCKWGHDITDPNNVYTDPKGRRNCRVCMKIREERKRRKRLEARQ